MAYFVYDKDMSNENKLWFRRKKYGWGWTPANRYGWLCLGAHILVVSLSAFFLLPTRVGETTAAPRLTILFLIVLSATFILVGICYAKGEPPKWQWGDKHEG